MTKLTVRRLGTGTADYSLATNLDGMGPGVRLTHSECDAMDQVNWTSIQGNWNQYKGQIKEKWGKLTDDDLMRIGGNRDQLIGMLQQRYGMAKDRVEEQVDEFTSKASGWVQQAKNKVAEVAEQGKEYWRDHNVGEMATDLKTLINRYPVQSTLVGLGVGYLVGRIFSSSRS
jgi:uncharacterized protein YjbJ (UPF0337 family)